MKKIIQIFILFLIVVNTGQSQASLFYKAKNLPCANKTFEVAFHVVKSGPSDVVLLDETAVLSMLIDVNQLFAPICFNFVIGEYHIIDNYNYYDLNLAEYDQMIIENNIKNRINVYFSGGGIAMTLEDNFSELNSISFSDETGVILVNADYFQLAHAFGRFFGLKHTYDDNTDELVDGSTCETTGDLLCDTPPDPYYEWDTLANYVNMDCRFVSYLQDPNGVYYEPDTGNIMSAYVDCWCGFTYDQYLKMYLNYKDFSDLW